MQGPALDSEIPAALRDERAHLAAARQALVAMQDRAGALDATTAGGSALSVEYLKAALDRRVRSLADDPETPLFFGRIDTADERHYIGRRHVTDEHGTAMVVDWRADVSRAFYRASRTEPMGLRLRRRFGFDRGALSAYEDERLTDEPERTATSRILQREIERPRAGPMRDIVATIQPEQDDIVRADLLDTICIQGAPGTGKTAVGLHRAAYLLYAHRDRLRRAGVLVVGPNRSFLDYVAQVLPALGEVEARHVTIEELVARVPVRASDSVAVATLKGDARLAEVLHRAVWSQLRVASEPLVVPRGSRRWRIPAAEVAEAARSLRASGVRYAAGRRLLAQRLAHAVLRRMEATGDAPDDRVQDAIAGSRPVRAMVDDVWPAVDPARLVWRLLADEEWRAEICAGVLAADEAALLGWERPARSPGTTRWSLADAVLVDEAADVIDREPSVGHVVLDEAQDLSPMQLRAVGRRCSTGSATVLGDVAQGTTPWATPGWRESLHHLGKPQAEVRVLERGFRVPRAVLELASRLLPTIAPGLAPGTSVRESPGSLAIRRVTDLAAATVAASAEAMSREGSVGLIATDDEVGRLEPVLAVAGLDPRRVDDGRDRDGGMRRLTVVPASLVKGLEFDSVVLVEPSAIVAAEPRGLRRLYVCLTRAVSALTVVHVRPLPPELVG